MRHTFEAEQWLPYPIELVFAFFADPQNLPHLMPAWQKPRIEEAMYAPPPPPPDNKLRTLAAGAGSRMTISFRPFPYSPFRVPWEAEISEFAWNDHFCDIQLRGPFAYWRHCHRLRAETRADQLGTLLRDELEYEMHFGTLGELAHSIAVRSQIKKIFTFRHKRTEELLALGAGSSQ
jgi:ligand-binding SRPBCC domain-containing protein